MSSEADDVSTIDVPWQSFVSPKVRTEFESEMPLFLYIPELQDRSKIVSISKASSIHSVRCNELTKNDGNVHTVHGRADPRMA